MLQPSVALQVPSPTKRIEYYDPDKAAADREILMKEKQLKHDLDEQVRWLSHIICI